MPAQRIGSQTQLNALKHLLQVRRARVAELQLQAATGKRIAKPSDDPAAAARAASLKMQLGNNDQMQSSVSQAVDWIESTEAALNEVVRLISDARVLALQGANDSQSPDSRAALGVGINQLLEQLAEASAATAGGDHLFSGEKFDVAPYAFTRDVDGQITAVTAESDIDGMVERLVDRELRVQVNTRPTATFGVGDPGQVDLFQLLIDARDALMANDGQGVANLLADFDDATDQVVAEISALGATIVQLNNLADRLGQRDLALQLALSESEDADLAETLIDLQSQETVLQAALSATARVQQLTLFDFI